MRRERRETACGSFPPPPNQNTLMWPRVKSLFPNLSLSDVWGWMSLCCGASVGPVGCGGASMASTCHVSGAPPPPVLAAKNASDIVILDWSIVSSTSSQHKFSFLNTNLKKQTSLCILKGNSITWSTLSQWITFNWVSTRGKALFELSPNVKD